MTNDVVVDTNILFSALLLEDTSFRKTIEESDDNFVIGESVFIELFKHKERIVRISRLTETEILSLLYTLLTHIRFERERLIDPQAIREAFQLCQDVDESDTQNVAMTIHLDGRLWTGDKQLRSGLEGKGFDRFFDP